MNKEKALFVTIITATMTLLVILGLFLLKFKALYIIVVGGLALYGFCNLALYYNDWLTTEKVVALDPVVVGETVNDVENCKFADKYNLGEIIDEVKNG